MSELPFHESHALDRPIRDLGLRIEGTRLEPLVERVRAELDVAGLGRVEPRFYLSTEWGVPFETVAIAIPFYLVSEELARLHAERSGHVEGTDDDDILRYLRHEAGHAVSYAHRLYERAEWESLFGPMRRAYRETYKPRPFSRNFVQHLPGFYAQKHPDEDWAETFATWLPGGAWRRDYEHWPGALKKLEWCDRAMSELRGVEPLVTDRTLDEDVGEIAQSLREFYAGSGRASKPLALDASLRVLFASLPKRPGPRAQAADLIESLRATLPAEAYRWTGHWPERTASLMRHLAERSRELGLDYARASEPDAIVAITALVTSLAATHVARGSYSG